MSKKSGKMNREASRRIQASQDKKGKDGDQSFKSRSMRAADRNSNKK